MSTLFPGETETDLESTEREGYFHRLIISLDMLGNVLFFNGDPDETISSHAGRAAGEGKRWGRLLAAFLSLFQKNHVAIAEGGDVERAQQVEDLEEDSKINPIY